MASRESGIPRYTAVGACCQGPRCARALQDAAAVSAVQLTTSPACCVAAGDALEAPLSDAIPSMLQQAIAVLPERLTVLVTGKSLTGSHCQALREGA